MSCARVSTRFFFYIFFYFFNFASVVVFLHPHLWSNAVFRQVDAYQKKNGWKAFAKPPTSYTSTYCVQWAVGEGGLDIRDM